MHRPKAALLFASGGGHASSHVAALQAIVDSGEFVPWSLVGGVSAGGLNAAMLAQYGVGDERAAIVAMRNQWLNWSQDNASNVPTTCGMYAGLASSLLGSAKPIVKDRVLDGIVESINVGRIQGSDRELRVLVTSSRVGGMHIDAKWHENTHDVLKATCAIPLIFSPKTINIDNRLHFCSDGACSSPIPHDLKGFDVVDIILSSPLQQEFRDAASRQQSGAGLLKNILDSSSTEKTIDSINKLAANNKVVRVYEPQVPADRAPFYAYSPADVLEAFNTRFTQERVDRDNLYILKLF